MTSNQAPEPAVRGGTRKMTLSTKVMIVTVPIVIVGLIVTILVATNASRSASREAAEAAADVAPGSSIPLVMENSHVLDDAGNEAPVLVEFLDFECEACGAVYPFMEQVREEYAGEITYVVRYFDTGHANSMNAALAAEAAAQQGEFEAMYHRLFETQVEWGEQQVSQADRFRTYAEDLGLDMEAYDAALADPATRERVEEDSNAGRALGVHGTPTLFLDGEMLQLVQAKDLTDALDQALAEGDE